MVGSAKITALACSDAPERYARWSLRLLTDNAVESGLCDHVSHTLVRDVLQKNDLKLHRHQAWCIGTINAAFLARLEQILALYAQPYDASQPVICFDERPCF